MPNSLVSHTYTHRARNPFISHTYAKTGGYTPLMFHVESNSAVASTYVDLSAITGAEAELTFLSHFHSQLHAVDCRRISVCLPVSSFTATLTRTPWGTPPLWSDQYLVEVADLKIGHYIRHGARIGRWPLQGARDGTWSTGRPASEGRALQGRHRARATWGWQNCYNRARLGGVLGEARGNGGNGIVFGEAGAESDQGAGGSAIHRD
jgi:hypothetical protein